MWAALCGPCSWRPGRCYPLGQHTRPSSGVALLLLAVQVPVQLTSYLMRKCGQGPILYNMSADGHEYNEDMRM